MSDNSQNDFEGFGSKAVHSGTNHVGDAVNTPIFQSSTYKLTDERYAGWQQERIILFFMPELHR